MMSFIKKSAFVVVPAINFAVCPPLCIVMFAVVFFGNFSLRASFGLLVYSLYPDYYLWALCGNGNSNVIYDKKLYVYSPHIYGLKMKTVRLIIGSCMMPTRLGSY